MKDTSFVVFGFNVWDSFENLDYEDLEFLNVHYIKFKIDNPVSPLELFQSPDARKLGLLVESIEILTD